MVSNAAREFLDLIKVYDVGYTKRRLGNSGDGGYVVLDEISRISSRLYSYGVGNEISFEQAFHSEYPRNHVRLFDHTVEDFYTNHPAFTFTKEGIGQVNRGDINTLRNHLDRFGDLEVPHKTLKLDIEWAEWDVLNSITLREPELLTTFDQILCEFHVIPVIYKDSHSPYFTGFHKHVYEQINIQLFESYKGVLANVLTQYVPFHVHINNSLPLVKIGEEKLPTLIELSLVKRSLIDTRVMTRSTDTFPINGLDFPNKSDRPDIIGYDWNRR